MERICKKCDSKFIPKKGLKNYCSLACRNSRTWSEHDKLKKSISAKHSKRVSEAVKRRNFARWKNHIVGQRIQQCSNCKCKFTSIRYPSGHYPTTCSDECYQQIKKKNFRGKNFIYKNINMDSSWEVELAKWLDRLDIKWIRPTYIQLESKKYYPDFYLPDLDIYLDPKNPMRIQQQKDDLNEINQLISLYYGAVDEIKKQVLSLIN